MNPDPAIPPIVNKVAASGLVTLDLADYCHQGERVLFDIKPWLFRDMLLREKDFREQAEQHNWEQYTGKNLAFTCSSDALIPTWAYMLLATKAEPFAHRYVVGDLAALEAILFNDALAAIQPSDFAGKRIIIKGCGDVAIPPSAYAEITHKLLPVAQSILYGEACSNVPVYKRKA